MMTIFTSKNFPPHFQMTSGYCRNSKYLDLCGICDCVEKINGHIPYFCDCRKSKNDFCYFRNCDTLSRFFFIANHITIKCLFLKQIFRIVILSLLSTLSKLLLVGYLCHTYASQKIIPVFRKCLVCELWGRKLILEIYKFSQSYLILPKVSNVSS